MAVRVDRIEPGSPAEKLGLAPGDELLAVDGDPLNDMLDYRFYTESAAFRLTVSRAGVQRELAVQKAEQQPFGCGFATYLADRQHSCANRCLFCFIDQLPPGLRESLYFKDDDERLSFLFGNYITFTNMGQREIDRIIRMHISPINVSVHTTDPALRVRMLANKRAGETLAYLKQLADAGIALNCQLVLCRGLNDGDALRRTLADLTALGPSVQSIAAVPAGVTRYREGLYPLAPYDRDTSRAVLDILEQAGEDCLARTGRRVIYPADEWYLCAERPMPPSAFYEDYAQLENGVGMWRLFHDEFLEELDRPHRLYGEKQMDLVTGTLAAPLITALAAELNRQYPMVQLTVHAIRNDFFGGNVGVAGLVTATDIIAQCAGRLQSRTLAVPEEMLRAERDLFLDSVSVDELAERLNVRVEILPAGGAACARALLKSGLQVHRRKKGPGGV